MLLLKCDVLQYYRVHYRCENASSQSLVLMLELETRTRSSDIFVRTIETTRLTQVQSCRFQLLDSFQHILYTVGRLCRTALPRYRGVCDHHGREF
jgi:hypothetical protein